MEAAGAFSFQLPRREEFKQHLLLIRIDDLIKNSHGRVETARSTRNSDIHKGTLPVPDTGRKTSRPYNYLKFFRL
jgi:hypothetical protein